MALGYFPVAVTVGVVARQSGLEVRDAAAMSLIVFAGASQLVAVEMLSGAASATAIVLTTFFVNLRHFLMSASLSLRLDGAAWVRPLAAFVITDESFVIASNDARMTSGTFLTLGVTAYLSWAAGTVTGASLAGIIPPGIADAMGVAIYALLAGILVPGVRSSWQAGMVAGVAGLTGWLLRLAAPSVAQGWVVLIAAVTAASVGLGLPRSADTEVS